MAISMLKIRRPLGRLIFNMGIAIPGKTVFLIETAPRCWTISDVIIIIIKHLFLFHSITLFYIHKQKNCHMDPLVHGFTDICHNKCFQCNKLFITGCTGSCAAHDENFINMTKSFQSMRIQRIVIMFSFRCSGTFLFQHLTIHVK